MAFTVSDFQDLIRLLGEHPEWRAELRRHVLSDELLELPTLVRDLADRLDRLEAAVERLVEAQAGAEARLDRIEAAIERLAELLVHAESRLGRLDGDVLELRYARRAPAYLSRLARRLRVMDTGVLADLLDDAVEERRLTEAEREAVLRTDLVLGGRGREDGAELYLLVEVSAGIGPGGVERAAERAAILEKLGRPVVPVVAGWQITAEGIAMARDRHVWQALDGHITPP